jgi:hypothetical protein
MKNIRDEAIIWAQLLTFVTIWACVLYTTKTPLNIDLKALKKLPEVVTIYWLLYLGFTRWAWRWRIFQGWLVPFPDLQGTWEGNVTTTWNPSGQQEVTNIPLSIVIKQSFDSISCTAHTRESVSTSLAAMLNQDVEGGIKRLSYTYLNVPSAAVRDRSTIHNGATVLRILSNGQRLEGQYWTDRRTTGDLVVTRRSRALAE